MGNPACDSRDDHPRRREDNKNEFNALEIVILLLKYKWMILSITVVAALIPPLFNILIVTLPSYQHPAISVDYKYARCTILAKGSSTESLVEALQSVNLRNMVIQNQDFMGIIGNGYWDSYNQGWSTKKILAREDIEATLMRQKIINGKDLISVVQYHDDPNVAQQILRFYLLELERYSLKEVENRKIKQLREKDDYIKALMREYGRAGDETIKRAVATHIALAIAEKQSIAVTSFQPFDVVEPPFINTIPPQYGVKIKQIKGFRIILLCAMFGFFMSLFIAFLIEYFRRLIDENPGKAKLLRRYLKW